MLRPGRGYGGGPHSPPPARAQHAAPLQLTLVALSNELPRHPGVGLAALQEALEEGDLLGQLGLEIRVVRIPVEPPLRSLDAPDLGAHQECTVTPLLDEVGPLEPVDLDRRAPPGTVAFP